MDRGIGAVSHRLRKVSWEDRYLLHISMATRRDDGSTDHLYRRDCLSLCARFCPWTALKLGHCWRLRRRRNHQIYRRRETPVQQRKWAKLRRHSPGDWTARHNRLDRTPWPVGSKYAHHEDLLLFTMPIWTQGDGVA